MNPKTEEHPRSEKFEAGLAVRREVLGDIYVDRALNNMNDFNADLQSLVSEYCWGTIWTRDGLERRERSLLNLAIMTALNRPHELATHVRGALRNGLTKAEIAEVFLQCAIYVGVPAAIDSFRVAESVFAQDQAD